MPFGIDGILYRINGKGQVPSSFKKRGINLRYPYQADNKQIVALLN